MFVRRQVRETSKSERTGLGGRARKVRAHPLPLPPEWVLARIDGP